LPILCVELCPTFSIFEVNLGALKGSKSITSTVPLVCMAMVILPKPLGVVASYAFNEVRRDGAFKLRTGIRAKGSELLFKDLACSPVTEQ